MSISPGGKVKKVRSVTTQLTIFTEMEEEGERIVDLRLLSVPLSTGELTVVVSGVGGGSG